MKKTLMLLSAVAALAVAGAAQAQDAVGEDSNWRFRSFETTVGLQRNSDMIQLQKSGYYDKLQHGALGAGGVGGPGGLLGAGSSSTANYYSVISQTTNNCSSSGAVGSPISCGSGGVTSNGNSQATVGSTLTSDTTTTGNTVTATGNTTQAGETITNNK